MNKNMNKTLSYNEFFLLMKKIFQKMKMDMF